MILKAKNKIFIFAILYGSSKNNKNFKIVTSKLIKLIIYFIQIIMPLIF